MTIRVDVWADFVCPWCFLGSIALEELRRTHCVEVHWHAFELRPPGSPPMPPEYLARIESSKPRLLTIAREHYGVTLNSGAMITQARRALIGDKYAASLGYEQAHHQAIFEAYWLHGARIDQDAVLIALAETLGMNGALYRDALDDPSWENEVQQDLFQARAMDITGVPATLFIGKYMISGAQPHAELVRVLEYIQQREAQP